MKKFFHSHIYLSLIHKIDYDCILCLNCNKAIDKKSIYIYICRNEHYKLESAPLFITRHFLYFSSLPRIQEGAKAGGRKWRLL